MKKDRDALVVIPAIIALTYLAVILAIHCIVWAIGSSIQNAASFGDIIAGFIAPYIGGLTIYFVYRAYQKQNESHEIQEKNINIQALNQLIQEMDQQKPEIRNIISMMWQMSMNLIISSVNSIRKLGPELQLDILIMKRKLAI